MTSTCHLSGVQCLYLFITPQQSTIKELNQGKGVLGHMQHSGLTSTITSGGGDDQHCLHHSRLFHIVHCEQYHHQGLVLASNSSGSCPSLPHAVQRTL